MQSKAMILQGPPYPWQRPTWDAMLSELHRGRLPHAVLLHGPAGLGKVDLALRFAQVLLCDSSNVQNAALPCGQCKDCLLYAAQTHPDFIHVQPAESGKAIRIDQIRSLAEFLAQTSQQGGRRCIVIDPADALNINASNALLKSLEEPPADVVFLLVAASTHKISATIRSRCRFVAISAPSADESQTWLCEQGIEAQRTRELVRRYPHNPLTALNAEELGQEKIFAQVQQDLRELAEGRNSTVGVAREWTNLDADLLIDHLLLELHAGVGQTISNNVAQDGSTLTKLIATLNPAPLFAFNDKLVTTKRLLQSGANPNKTLLWEDLLLDWLKMSRI